MEVEILGGTFSSSDQARLLHAIIAEAPYARGCPTGFDINLVDRTPPPDWVRIAIGSDDRVAARWGYRRTIAWEPDAIAANFPDVPIEPTAVAHFISRLPFEVAVMSNVTGWTSLDYRGPAIAAGHALFGWAIAFKGAGHEHALVSRRWLEHGPWRIVHGPEDTTLVQFHDLAADDATAITQARPGHRLLVAGYLRPQHDYQHDVRGLYTAEDRLLRIVVVGRDVPASEMTDACAARRDNRDDPEKPIANVAFIFVERDAAERHLPELWLRGLECRVVEDGVERRLDDSYHPVTSKPAWVEALQ